MKHLALAAFFTCVGVAAEASVVTYDFTAHQTYATSDAGVTGIADAVRDLSTITGSITFDTTPTYTSSTIYGFAAPVITVAGVDMTEANSWISGAYTLISSLDEEVASGTRGFPSGTPVVAQQVSFRIVDPSFTLLSGSLSFPDPLRLIGTGTIGFNSTVWDGSRTGADEGVEFQLDTLTPEVPVPAGFPLLLSAIGLLGLRVRRRCAVAR